jgi:hypothetical protein
MQEKFFVTFGGMAEDAHPDFPAQTCSQRPSHFGNEKNSSLLAKVCSFFADKRMKRVSMVKRIMLCTLMF